MLVLLQSKRAVSNAFAYNAGILAFRLSLGGISYFVFSNVEEVVEAAGGDFENIVGMLLLILGLLMLIFALRKALSAHGADDMAASWLAKFESVKPIQAALIGFVFLALDPKDWLIDISAIDLILNADLNTLESWSAYFFYLFLAQSIILIPAILQLVIPDRMQRSMWAINHWIERHEHKIEIITAIIFGLILITSGLAMFGNGL